MSDSRLTPFVHETDGTRWNQFVHAAPTGHLMQGYEWGEFKRNTGWTVQRVGLERNGQIVAGAQLLFRSAPGGLPFSLAYLSKGPVVEPTNQKLAVPLWQLIHQAARAQGAVFLIAEPHWLDTPAAHDHLRQQQFIRSPYTNHPHSTLIIDLSPDEEQLLLNMRKKTRQLIRKAGRNGVEIVEGDRTNLQQFYKMLAITADLKDIEGHERQFYREAWAAYQKTDTIQLFLAQYHGETVAAKMVFAWDDRSLHLWGGTSRKGRDMQASYLIQWTAIQWAKRHGCRYSDLWGIPDEVGKLLKRGEDIPQDKRSGLWGVYLFKRGFGGEVESYVGTYNYIYQPRLYRLVQFAMEKRDHPWLLKLWHWMED